MNSYKEKPKICGLIINPVAGMGGAVGLKGTDGEEILKKAISLGAVPRAETRTIQALEMLKTLKDEFILLTGPGPMGQDAAVKSGFNCKVIGSINKDKTSSEDTVKIASAMKKEGADIILFAGGDGTARDIFKAVGRDQVCLGIPAGVKIHSAVYARNPVVAGELASMFIQSKIRTCVEAEVLDINEEEYRKERLNTELFGYLKVPWEKSRLQRLKAGSLKSDRHAQEAIAHHIIEEIDNRFAYVIGAGSTLKPLMELLRLDFSLLGVDIVYKNNLVLKDGTEKDIINTIKDIPCKLIITPIGGQGYIFGRGNLQLSPKVIKIIGKENIIIAATNRKLQSLRGAPLLTDTGDMATDEYLEGIYRVITGYHQTTMYRVKK